MPEPSPRLPWWRRWFGIRCEDLAADYLARRGHRLLARNWRCSLGEVDLITLDGQSLVFVEVRSTAAGDVSRPAFSVDQAKQRRLTKVALAYLQRHGLLGKSARFDVILVSHGPGREQAHIEHLANAFSPDDAFRAFS